MAKRVRVCMSIDADVWARMVAARWSDGMVASRIAERAFVSQLVALEAVKLGAGVVQVYPEDYRRSV